MVNKKALMAKPRGQLIRIGMYDRSISKDVRDPEGKRLIKLDSTSNGEFVPIPLDATNRRANRLAQTWASENARRRGVDRRTFMVSACGAASTLLAFNAGNAAAGRTGGFFAGTGGRGRSGRPRSPRRA